VGLSAEPPTIPERRPLTTARVLRTAGHPAVLILAVAGVMSMLSDTRTVDGLALVVVAVLLAVDLLRTPAAPPPRGRIDQRRARLPGPVWAGAGALTIALAVGDFERYSWQATAVVWTLAGVAALICWPPPRSEADPLPRTGVVVWAGWAVTLGLWELAALLGQPSLMTGSWARPTISVLMDPVLATYPGRVGVFAVWLLAGWALCRTVLR
jgi:hypothetical protein